MGWIWDYSDDTFNVRAHVRVLIEFYTIVFDFQTTVSVLI